MTSRFLPVASPADVRRYALVILRRHPRLLGGTLALYAAAVLFRLAGPRLLGDLVQSVQQGTTVGHVGRIALLLFGFVVVQSVLTRFGGVEGGKLSQAVLSELREEFVGNVLALPLSTVEEAGAGDLVTRASRDVDALRFTAQYGVPTVLTGLSTIVLTVIAMAFTSVGLCLALLAGVPPIWLASRWYLRRATDAYLAQNAAFTQITEQLSATVAGAATIEAQRLGERRIEAGDASVSESFESQRATLRLRTVFLPVIEFGYCLPMVAALLLGGYFYDRGWASLSAVTAVVLYCQQIISPVAQLLELLANIQTSTASLARLLGVSHVPPDREAGGQAVADPRDLVGSEIRFGYGAGRDVLHGIDLTVVPGERLAMVGPSGAGKSTLGRLLAGIHGPRTGSVRIGGASLIELPLDDLRGEVALVSQDQHVFAGTLRENLELAAAGTLPDDEQLWAALDAVDALDWARVLPGGLDAKVGSGGAELDPAQSQQLALARLLIADPKVLVLDEATSLLDPRSARHLERSLSAVLKGRTVIAIAHRLHTAHDADRVAVVEDGVIAELGSHTELIAADGAYSRLWSSWHGETAASSVGGPTAEPEA
ncbi:MAG TPA: ABC transporter ATP-binding protein [Actinocrinis sp.]|nr:ABC transporter ATP-binding protein [Actinocrinis sp.]